MEAKTKIRTKKPGVTIHMSDKLYFIKKEGKEKQRRALHNYKKINPTKGYNNCKCLCTPI